MPSLIQKQAMMRERQKDKRRKTRQRRRRIPKGMSQHPLYNTWNGMIHRCLNPVNVNFRLYGQRGVKVCKRWLGKKGFLNFIEDVGPRPPNTSIDRYPNPFGDYEPENIRWATAKQQAENTRKKYVERRLLQRRA